MVPHSQQILRLVLVLVVGIGIGALGHSAWLRVHRDRSAPVEGSSDLSVIFIPDADFTEEAQRSPGISASIRLQGVVDINGQMKNVRPFPSLPYNVSESVAGSPEFPDVTPTMVSGKFAKELPYNLTDAAIRHAQSIHFLPRKVNGEAVSEQVHVIIKFGFVRSPIVVGKGCNSIKLTIFNKSRTVWEGQTSVSRYDGCMLI